MKGSVLVTGGARRIGRAICEMLAARGWRVLAHSRDPDNPLHADLALPGEADRLFAAAVREAPDLCAVVNNAAMFSTAAELPADEAATIQTVNVTTPMRLTELLATYLAERHAAGSVVNLLDTRILIDFWAEQDHREIVEHKRLTPYAASKLALARATLDQARHLAPALRVNGVAPGPVLPPADAACREKGGDILLPRRPLPADVASAVVFLLEAEAVTGQVLAVDSGQCLLKPDLWYTRVASRRGPRNTMSRQQVERNRRW